MNLLSETRNDTESGDKSDDDSTMPSLIIEEEIIVISSGDESDAKPMSMDALEDIHDRSHYSETRRSGFRVIPLL